MVHTPLGKKRDPDSLNTSQPRGWETDSREVDKKGHLLTVPSSISTASGLHPCKSSQKREGDGDRGTGGGGHTQVQGDRHAHISPQHENPDARIPRWPKRPPVTSGLGACSFVLPVSWRDSLDKGERSTSPKTSWAYTCLEGKWLERDNLQGSSSPSAA